MNFIVKETTCEGDNMLVEEITYSGDNMLEMIYACMLNCFSMSNSLTLCDPLDCSPSGSSVHGILQARILEWVAMIFSRGSSQPRD